MFSAVCNSYRRLALFLTSSTAVCLISNRFVSRDSWAEGRAAVSEIFRFPIRKRTQMLPLRECQPSVVVPLPPVMLSGLAWPASPRYPFRVQQVFRSCATNPENSVIHLPFRWNSLLFHLVWSCWKPGERGETQSEETVPKSRSSDIGEPFLIRDTIPSEAPDFGKAFNGASHIHRNQQNRGRKKWCKRMGKREQGS